MSVWGGRVQQVRQRLGCWYHGHAWTLRFARAPARPILHCVDCLKDTPGFVDEAPVRKEGAMADEEDAADVDDVEVPDEDDDPDDDDDDDLDDDD